MVLCYNTCRYADAPGVSHLHLTEAKILTGIITFWNKHKVSRGFYDVQSIFWANLHGQLNIELPRRGSNYESFTFAYIVLPVRIMFTCLSAPMLSFLLPTGVPCQSFRRDLLSPNQFEQMFTFILWSHRWEVILSAALFTVSLCCGVDNRKWNDILGVENVFCILQRS